MDSGRDEDELERLAELLDRRERSPSPAGAETAGLPEAGAVQPGQAHAGGGTHEVPGAARKIDGRGTSGEAATSSVSTAAPPAGPALPGSPGPGTPGPGSPGPGTPGPGSPGPGSPGPGSPGPGSPGAGSYSFTEACSLLNLSPYTLRGLLADYGEVLGMGAGDQDDLPAGQRRLSEWSFRLLKEAVALRNAGMGREEIRDRLRALAEAAAGLAVVPGYRGPGTSGALVRYVDRATARDLLLIEKIEQLNEQLVRSEQKRLEDRDRLLMALLRTQQEIQQLRYELAARGTRRDRKRRGLLARLFGAP